MERLTALAILMTASIGCGHTSMNGSVVMTTGPGEAHVCLTDGDVAVGEIVRIRRHTCEGNGRAGITCVAADAGRAEVTALLGTHYASVRALEGATIHDGDTVERTH